MKLRTIVISVLLIVGGCTGESPTSAGPATEDAIIALYTELHENADVNGMMKLVYWKGVEEPMRQMVRKSFQEASNRKIKRVEVLPAQETQLTEYTRAGVRYRTNLEVIGNLEVIYDDPGVVTSSMFPLGKKDGVFFITTAAPVS